MYQKAKKKIANDFAMKIINSDKSIVDVSVVIENKKWYEKFYEWIMRKIK